MGAVLSLLVDLNKEAKVTLKSSLLCLLKGTVLSLAPLVCYSLLADAL